MGRIIALRHRVKKNRDNEAKPTQVAVWENDNFQRFDLPDETAEMDFVKGKVPISWRVPQSDEDVSKFSPHHCHWRKMKKNEKPKDFPKGWTCQGEDKSWQVLTKVPDQFAGLQSGDTVLMVLGGSGDYLAFAMSRRGESMFAKVKRVKPKDLKEYRGNGHKDDDSINLIKLYQCSPELFQEVTPRDRALIRLRILFVTWQEAMAARMAYEQRLFQWLIGSKFTEETELYLENEEKKVFGKKKPDENILAHWARGVIKLAYEWAKKRDKVLQALKTEESKRSRELEAHLETLDVYTKILKPVEGCGPKIAARLIVAIGDIRRFDDSPRPDGKVTRGKAKIKRYCGACPNDDGEFLRRRSGEVANWNNQGRLALYLIGDQFNRRPKSVWGQKLLEYKAKLRLAHPDVICKDCSQNGPEVKWADCPDQKHHKRAYNDGHIHKMALWRTATKFLEWVYKEWKRLENDQLTAPLPKDRRQTERATEASAGDSLVA